MVKSRLFSLLFVFLSLRVLEERMWECHCTTSGSVGRSGDTKAKTVIRDFGVDFRMTTRPV